MGRPSRTVRKAGSVRVDSFLRLRGRPGMANRRTTLTHESIHGGRFHSALAWSLDAIEHVAAIVLAVDVVVVFCSVIWRYFLHQPFHWAEEIARALMGALVFLGAATALGRAQHVGVDSLRGLFPVSWRAPAVQLCHWIIVAVSTALLGSAVALLIDSQGQTTPIGLPQSIYVWPLVAGSLLMGLFGVVSALNGPWRSVWGTLAGGLLLALAVWGWNTLLPSVAVTPVALMLIAFVVSFVIGVPIAFALAFASLLYFLSDPSLPMLVYSQQVTGRHAITSCCSRFRSSCSPAC